MTKSGRHTLDLNLDEGNSVSILLKFRRRGGDDIGFHVVGSRAYLAAYCTLPSAIASQLLFKCVPVRPHAAGFGRCAESGARSLAPLAFPNIPGRSTKASLPIDDLR